MECIFDDKLICTVCKKPTTVLCRRNCTVKMTIAERTKSFASAMWEYVKGDGSFLPQEKIQARLDICQMCPHFTGNRCNICGCGVGPEQKLMNKLAHPHTFCPDSPPRWNKSLE